MKKIFLVIVFLQSVLFAQLIAQNQSYVHLDKSFYVTGEVIWYKLYLPSFMEGSEAVIKSTLVNASGDNVSYHFNATEAKTSVSGYFKLPFDMNSEIYSIVFSGTRGKDFPQETFAEIHLPIYNDLETTQLSAEDQDVVLPDYNKLSNSTDLSIEVDLSKEQYNCREHVAASVQVRDANGNPVNADLSISVIDADLYDGEYQIPAVFEGSEVDRGAKPFVNKPYVKGAYSRGTRNKLLNNEIIGAYSSSENKLFYAVPNSTTGNFHVEFAAFKNSKPIQFIHHVESDDELNIELAKVGSPNTKQLVYNKAVLDYLELSRQRKKLFQRYSTLETNLVPEENVVVFNEFKKNKTFDITEYKSFDNLASFLKEVSTPLRMRIKDDSYEGAMYMPSSKKDYSSYAEHDPLYIVNGYITRNSDFIGKLDLENIKELSMMYEPKDIRSEYKIFGGNGVVNLKINSKDIVLPEEDQKKIYNLSGFQADTPYPEFIPSEFDDNQPFFRPQLYWNSSLSTDGSGNADFGFFQSDDISTFVIEVVAKTSDGKIATTQKTYTSVWQ